MNKKTVNSPIKIIQILPGQEQPPKSPLLKPPRRSELPKKVLLASKRALAWLTTHARQTTLRIMQAGRSFLQFAGQSLNRAVSQYRAKHPPVAPRSGNASDAAVHVTPIEEPGPLKQPESPPSSQPLSPLEPLSKGRKISGAEIRVRDRLSRIDRILRARAALTRKQLDAARAAFTMQWPRRRQELKARQAAANAALSLWSKRALAFLVPRTVQLREKAHSALRLAQSKLHSMSVPGHKRDLAYELETAKSILQKQQQDLADLGAQLTTVKRDMEAQKQMVAAFAKRLEGAQRSTVPPSSPDNRECGDTDQSKQAMLKNSQERNPVRS
ncbi:MAG: hypothetical protein C4293_11745 [Nitrospiraceae bacterium]